MTRRGGRWTRVGLRLGLLLGGVVVVWGVHEAATTGVAYAADRPPSAPVDAAVDLLTGVLRPILDTAASPPAPDLPADEAAPGATPAGALPRPAPGPATWPADQVTPPPAGPVQVGTSKPAVGVGHPATRPGGGEVLAPVAGVLRPVTEPVRSGVLTPVADALRPVTDPVRAGVVAPVADALTPVTQPLAPILSPVWRELEPVLKPLDPVLEPLEPVTDLLDPPTGLPAKPPPAATPPTGPVGDPLPYAGLGCSGPATGSVTAPARLASGPAPSSIPTDRHSTPQLSSLPRLAESDGPYPQRPDAGSAPATPTPGTSGSGSSGAVLGNPADTPTSVWTPPSLAGYRCHPTGGDALPSRSPRPGTRPA